MLEATALKLDELKRIWMTQNGAKELIEIYKEDRGRYIEYLYHVIFSVKTKEYGRHAGLRIRVDPRTLDVLEHDVFDRLGY
ncbi:MAG: hypothetical protein ACFFC5_03425 [Promethearchaeota archaeon]